MTSSTRRQDVRGVTPTRRAVVWWTALAIACACPVTHAATRTWTGLGADDNWTTGGNWSVPLVATDTPQFEGSTRLTPFNDFAAGTSFVGISFSSAATGSFTVSGNSITLTGNVNNNSSSALTQTVNLGLVLSGATRAISSSTTGNTVINGAISGSQALNLSMGGGTVILAGNNSHTGVTTITNSGTYTLSGNNTAMTGGVTVSSSGATLNINHAAALGTGTYNHSGTINNTSGNAITLSTNPAINVNATLNFTGSNDLNMGAGAVTIVNASVVQRTFNIVGGELTFGGGIGQSISGLGLIKNGAGTLVLNGASTYSGRTSVNAGVLRLGHVNAVPGGIGATGGSSELVVSTGGVIGLEADDFRRGLSSIITATTVTFGTGGGGFAAYSNDRVVRFGDNASNLATWGSGGFIPAGASLILGAADADKKVTIENPIALTNANRTIDVRNGTAPVDGELAGALSSSTSAGGITKIGDGTLLLSSSANTYTGATNVNAGRLLVNGSIATSSGVTVAASATLGGSGVVSAISGAGWVDPGNSPGVLTAPTVDPSLDLGFNFEFTAPGSPTYNAPLASVNDVLRLTHATTPFTGALTAGNTVNIYLHVAGLNPSGEIFRGAWYTDRSSDFLADVVNATYNFYIYGDGNGSDITYNSVDYYTLNTSPYTINISTIAETADFGAGNINGFVTEFEFTLNVIPEPATAAILGLAALVWFRRRQGRVT